LKGNLAQIAVTLLSQPFGEQKKQGFCSLERENKSVFSTVCAAIFHPSVTAVTAKKNKITGYIRARVKAKQPVMV